jgi:hypothetical protein
MWELQPIKRHQPPHENGLNLSGAEVNGNISVQPRARKRKARQPTDTQWQHNKTHIARLYMKANLALPEVVQLMESDHGFSASEKMYKDRFKMWHWSKNLPYETASWMAEKAQQRLPRKTTFDWNNQVWTEEKLLMKFGKQSNDLHSGSKLLALVFKICALADGGGLDRPAVCAATPIGITYYTPATPVLALTVCEY